MDADGTQYTVWVKWVGGQCIYRPHKRVNCSYRVVPDTKWHQTEQAAQTELDIEASVQAGRKKKMGTEPLEKENADLKRQLEERRNLAKKRFYADLLIYCLLEINLFAIMTQQWDVKLLYFFLAEVVGLLVWTGWAFFWESRKS